MKNLRSKNLNLLKKNHIYSENQEHDACGVGLVASTEGKKSRKVVEYGIKALKAVWHRGAVDADGKTGDCAGLHIEIPYDFFVEKIKTKGHKHDGLEICVGMVFLPRDNFNVQETCKTIFEKELKVTEWGTIKIDFDTLETNIPGVFAAGDIVRGASLVVWAIKDGRDAALSIDKFLEDKIKKKQKVA